MVRGHLKAYLFIAFVWLGLIYSRVSYHFGGTVLIGIGYVFLILILYPGKISFETSQTKLYATLKCFLLFIIVYIVSIEIFSYPRSEDLFGLQISIDTFHMIKSVPIWLAAMILLRDEKHFASYCSFVLVLIFADMLLTMAAIQAIPEFAKNLTAGIVSEEMLPYKINGAMGYELTYSVVLLIPLVFVYGYKKKKAFFCVFSAVAVIYVFRCSFVTALFAMIVNIVLSLCFLIKFKAVRYIVFCIIFTVSLYLLLEQTTIGNLLMLFSENVESVELRLRFEQLSRLFLYNDSSGASLGRFELYKSDLQGILNSPIFGSKLLNSGFDSSGHSTFMGIWSSYGLISIVLFLLSIWNAYLFSIRCCRSERIRGVVWSAYVSFIFISIVNPVFADPHIMLSVLWLIPMLSNEISKTIRV